MFFPTKYQKRIDYWNSNKLRISKQGTKIFRQTIEHLKHCTEGSGVYSDEPVSMNEFKLSVDRFAETVFNPEYRPVSKKSIRNTPLAEFIYNPFCHPKRRLLHFLKNEPQLIATMYASELYEPLCQSYAAKNGLSDSKSLTIDQLENISLASRKLTDFFKEHGDKIDPSFIKTDRDRTDLFVRHALDHIKGNIAKFSTRALTYNSVWEMLPNFFQQHGYFVTTKRKSMAQIEESINANRTATRPILKRRSTRLRRP